MSDKLVAYSPNLARLTRLVGEQAAEGNQVMAAFLNLEHAEAYAARRPFTRAGEFSGELPPAPAWEPAPPAEAMAAETMVAGDMPPAPPMPVIDSTPPAPPPPTPVAVNAPGQLEAVSPRAHGGRGQVFAVYSPRGGAGTSVLAAALASRVAQDQNLRVLLVDLDLQNGSQSYFFDITEMKRSSILGLKPLIDEILVRAGGNMDRVAAEAAGVISEEILLNKCFRKDNLYVLCALDDPAAIDDYQDPSSHMEALVDVLSNNFDVVILDLPNTVDMFTAPALFRADRILVVTPEDVPSQIKVARMLNLVLAPMIEARDLRVQDRCFTVVSRSGKKKLDVPMPVGIAAAVPDDRKFCEAFIEKHQPYPRVAGTNYGKAIAGLSTFLGVAGPSGKK